MQTDIPSSQSGPSDLDWAHPLVRDWFAGRFGTPTEPQALGWPSIAQGKTTLISSPTGSGKTLAAFLICIDRLVRKALAGALEDRTEVLYVSPLKALVNDIHKNLEIPLREILELAAQRGMPLQEIRAMVRTGDTPARQRRSMVARPPHILVTTPESLYLLLTAEKTRALLKSVKTVIVDEIHAVAGDKRGAHLALSLERLEHLCGKIPIRIGLSATQKPIETIANFLTGNDQPASVVVQAGLRRTLDLAVEVPASELGAVASNEMWDEIYDRLAELARQHRSTLIFVNTRRLAERITHHLGERLGPATVATHHGSLSRKLRWAAEQKLKQGEARALVATASLELGIDIGSVDLVCLIGSPRSVSTGVQRIGRAGHWRGAIPKGRIFATTRDELLECAALVFAIRQGDLDRIVVPEAPLDILSQQIVAACAAEDWREEELFQVVRRAYPYRELSQKDFDEVIAMLSEGIAARRGRHSAYLHRDQVHGRVRGRRGSRLAALTSGGAIPDNSLYSVIAMPEGATVGTVDEDFAVESMAGDIFLLGNTSWKIRRVQSGSVQVEDAQGAPPNVPFWRGEAPSRTSELSARVAEVREKISGMVPRDAPRDAESHSKAVEAAIQWMKEQCGLDDAGAQQAVEYIVAGRTGLGAVPTLHTVIAERFFDESGGMQLVIHAPFGGRINKAWGLALRKRFCRSFNFELQASATDNGINISLAEQHSFPLADVFHFVHAASAQQVLEQAVLASPLFTTRWRWDAGRALALLRFRGGKKVPPQIQRMRADDLLASVFPEALACAENITGEISIPDHPLIREVMKDVLTEAMDIEGFERVLKDIGAGRITCLAVDTPVPSQFAHEILNANPYAFLDDAPLEERRARAVEMRRVLPETVLSEIGRLDPTAIEEVRADAWPDVRDTDELHDALLTLIALPAESAAGPAGSGLRTKLEESVAKWNSHFTQLCSEDRAASAQAGTKTYWVAAERTKNFLQIYPSARVGHIADMGSTPSREDALLTLVTGWLAHTGPVTARALADLLDISSAEIDKTLLRMEASGAVLRGQFTGFAEGKTEWCERRLLARIHVLTRGKLRKDIEPVNPAQFMRWLLRWQHVAPGTQLPGERGTLEVIRQVQGFEAPASAWEAQILSRRIARYDPGVLDQLCLSGAVGWGRLSPHPATLETLSTGTRRVVPTRVAPIAFFVREEADWMMSRRDSEVAGIRALSPAAVAVAEFLRQRGASFFPDIVRATRRLKAEVETALWELVAAGLLTADGFDNLRSLIDPRRRAGQGRGRNARPRHSTGRWSLLDSGEAVDRNSSLEAACRMLLRRYGVVFRELLSRETILPKWREVKVMLRMLEDRGEIRGGRFVSGFWGEQFALPTAVESLRVMRRLPPSGETVVLSAADPLNLAGIVIPGERVPSLSGQTVAFRDGVAVPATERSSPISFEQAG